MKRAAFGYASIVGLAIVVAVGLRWPLLHTGFYLDDFIHLEMLRGRYPLPRQALDLFCFTQGAPENGVLRTAGFLPWWSHPDIKLSLFRPMASALIWIDHGLFGNNAFAYHLHTLCWWVALIAVFGAVLREILPPPAAVLALVVTLAHPGHILLLGWLASRNAVVATTFVLFGFFAHLRMERARSSSTRLTAGGLAFGAYVAAILTSEYALAVLPYPAAYSFMRLRFDSRRLARLLALWGLPCLAYFGLRSLLGYGAHRSGMYVDPFAEPLAYMHAALVRLPIAVGEVVLAVRATWLAGFPWPDALRALSVSPQSWPRYHVALGVLGICVGIYVALQLWCRRAAFGSGRMRFVILALPLTFAPILTTLPDSRTLLPSALGWSMVLAQWLWASYTQLRNDRHTARNWLHFLAAASLWVLGSIGSPYFSAGEIRELPRLAAIVRAGILDRRLDEHIQSGPVLLVAAAEPTTFLLPMVRSWNGRPVPSSFQVLGQPLVPQRLERLNKNTFAIQDTRLVKLEMHVPDAFNRDGVRPGQRADVNDMHVTVERVFQGRATRVRFEFDRPLTSYVLLTQTRSGLERVEIPEVGQSIVLSPPVHPVDLVPQP